MIIEPKQYALLQAGIWIESAMEHEDEARTLLKLAKSSIRGSNRRTTMTDNAVKRVNYANSSWMNAVKELLMWLQP